jgi:hypothetical protein
MSLRECIINAAKEGPQNGGITQEQAKVAGDLFEGYVQQLSEVMGKTEAEVEAGIRTYKALQTEAARKKYQTVLQVGIWKDLEKNMLTYRNYRGESDIAAAAEAIFARDDSANFRNIEYRQTAVEKMIFSKMSEVLGTFRRNIIGGTRAKATQRDMIREGFGEDSGNQAAKELYQSWAAAAEYGRLRFNRAGGAIAKNDGWGFPQQHDTVLVRKATAQEWVDFVLPKLNINKMIDETTGQPFLPGQLNDELFKIYEKISTDGMAELIPGNRGQGTKLANRRTDHRFLVFKDADSWMSYQERFGNPDIFDVMMTHVKSMSRDIAFLETLGPNPTSTINYIKQWLDKEASKAPGEQGDKLRTKVAKSKAKIDQYYSYLSGATNGAIDSRIGYTFAGTRSLLQSAQLGSASIAAITDVNFQRMTREFNGLPVVDTLTDYLKEFALIPSTERGKLAIRLGLIADGYSAIAAGQARFVGEVTGPEIARRIGDATMKLSLLSPMTNAGRFAFGMEFLGHLADQAGKSFDELDPKFRAAMERYGIGANSWEIIRTTKPYEHEGATFLRPDDIEARSDISPGVRQELATRLLEMVHTETNFAVPSASLRGRVALIGENKPGTLGGEILRSFAMYKNFSVTLMDTHLKRGMKLRHGKGRAAFYADLFISTTIMGALALQLKEISKGRDPRPMNTPEFWGAALLQGGGLGIFGDFLASPQNRMDNGIAETIAGPVFGLGADVHSFAWTNIQRALKGEDTKIAADFVGLAARYTPGSSLWYLRLAMDRLVIEQLQRANDPDASARFRRKIRKYRKDYNQEYWWAPGQTAPDRAPDIGNMVAPAP